MTARHEELKVFQLADRLALDIYRLSGGLPAEERDGLQPQLRRAAVAVPIGIIEGCARSVAAERAQMVGAALGAAAEMRYLLSLLHRLDLIDGRDFDQLNGDYDLLVRGLQKFASARRDGNGTSRPRDDDRDDADDGERPRSPSNYSGDRGRSSYRPNPRWRK